VFCINKYSALIIRLKKISLKEFMYLNKQVLLLLKLSFIKKFKKNVLFYYSRKAAYNFLVIPKFNLNNDSEIIKKILDGFVFNLNSNSDEIKKKFEELRPLNFFKILINSTVTDIRQLWEPHRLQHLTMLFVYILKDFNNPENEKIKLFCKNEILKWIYNNPFPFGPNYISVMECGLRIPVFFYCLKILDNLQDFQIEKILETIYSHAWIIFRRLSLYSSLGNHTVAECVGLIFAGSIFQDDKEAKKWFKKAINILVEELSHQILDDGGPAEQSFQYLRFILDLYWLAISFMENNKLHDCNEFKAKLIKAEKFLMTFVNKKGYLPSIGDSDNGFAIAPYIAPQIDKFSSGKKNIQIYKNSGYTLIHTKNNVQLTFDHGPLGLSPLYNHGHADALSITMSKDSKMILVDPGTYRYNGAYKWRMYFKGTRAHNTVTVDGLDQSVQETGFIWSRPYNVKLLGLKDNKKQFLIQAIHDGYIRLKLPVWHQRDLLIFNETCFLLRDSFKGQGLHNFEINFHLHPDASSVKFDDWWMINNQGCKIFLRLLEGSDFKTINGQTCPIHGWFSQSYGEKTKTNVLTCKRFGFPYETSFITAICTQFPVEFHTLEEKLRYFDK
jgi:Heparinase II/III-like protein/Heparinase II/III N-terminus